MDSVTRDNNANILYNSNREILGVKGENLYTIKWYNLFERIRNWVSDPKGTKVADVSIKTLKNIEKGLENNSIDPSQICITSYVDLNPFSTELRKILHKIENDAYKSPHINNSIKREIESYIKSSEYKTLPTVIKKLLMDVKNKKRIWKNDYQYRRLWQDENHRNVDHENFGREIFNASRFKEWLPMQIDKEANLTKTQTICMKVSKHATAIMQYNVLF